MQKHSILPLAVAIATAATAALHAEDNTGWQSSAGVNFSVARGNSKSLLLGANILSQKKWNMNELSLGADANYGDNSGVKNVENYGGAIQYNRLLNDRLYIYGRGDIRRDEIAAINYRVTLSPGVGYYFIKNDKTTLSGELGPGFVLEQLKGSDPKQYLTLRVGEKFTHKFNDKVSLIQEAEYLPKVDDFGNYVINASATLDAALTEKFSVRTTLKDTYRSEPAVGRLKNDVMLLAGIAYKF